MKNATKFILILCLVALIGTIANVITTNRTNQKTVITIYNGDANSNNNYINQNDAANSGELNHVFTFVLKEVIVAAVTLIIGFFKKPIMRFLNKAFPSAIDNTNKKSNSITAKAKTNHTKSRRRKKKQKK